METIHQLLLNKYVIVGYIVVGAAMAINELAVSNDSNISKTVDELQMPHWVANLIIFLSQVVIMAIWPIFLTSNILKFIAGLFKKREEPAKEDVHLIKSGLSRPICDHPFDLCAHITEEIESVTCSKCLEIANMDIVIIPASRYELRYVDFNDIPFCEGERVDCVKYSGIKEDCIWFYTNKYLSDEDSIIAMDSHTIKYREKLRLNYYYLKGIDSK